MAGSGAQDRRPTDAGASGGPTVERLAERLAMVMRLARLGSNRTEIANLSNARYEFLHTLYHHGPERMGLVAQRLDVSARTVTPMVDALEAEGLISRTVDPTDRRAQLIELTSQGSGVLKAARRTRLAAVDPLFDSLSPEERTVLAELLSKIINAAGSETRDSRRPGTRR